MNAVVPAGVSQIGFVAADRNGRLLVAQPRGEPGGVSATFSKITLNEGQSPSDALIQVIREQVGVPARTLYPVPTVWVTPIGTSYYFAGHVDGADDGESPAGARLRWCAPAEAAARIAKSANPVSRQRDLALARSVAGISLSPHRRILLMVRELHRMGYERLRAPAYDYPIAWRCPIVPAQWTLEEHGGRMVEGLWGAPFREHGAASYTYTSASGQEPFGWSDAVFAEPAELARRFISAFPEIAVAGWGPDAEYASWFESALAATAPEGVYAAFSEWEGPSDVLYARMASIQHLPLPPPGGARTAEWEEFHARHPRP